MNSTVPAIPGNLRTGFFENSCSTVFKTAKFRYKWSIYDFSTYYCDLQLKEKIESSIFSDDTKDGLKWRLEMNSQGWQLSGYIEFLNIRLNLISNNIGNLQTICKICILNKELKQVNSIKKNVLFTENVVFVDFNYVVSKANLLNQKNLFLPDDKLTILCEVIVLGSSANISSQLVIPNDLGLILFENPDVSVVTFSVAGRELHALKTILVAKSPVFAAMFSHDTIERQTNRIQITDVDYDVLREMLRFLYTNKISGLKEIADRLLIVADKYELENLKHRCEESLSKYLTIENVTRCFVLAHQYNGEELKIRAKTFIMANSQDVVKSVGFKSLFVEHPLVFRNLGLFA